MTHSPRAEATSEYVLEPNEMLFISTQIACGMEYLAGHHYVHRYVNYLNDKFLVT